MKLILASESEWRERLVSWLGEPYEVQVSGLDESVYSIDDAEELVATLAAAKAEKVVESLEKDKISNGRLLVIGADTEVVLNREILGKPENIGEAKLMITSMQGKSHTVLTGVCVMDADTKDRRVEVDTTTVTFAKMTERQIDEYLKTGDWKGKAGGYQILRSIDAHVDDVDGSVTNVIGLPLELLVEMMDDLGVSVGTDVSQVIRAETGYER